MIGEPIDAMELGVAQMLAGMRRNPYALETVALSVIAFDRQARVLTPLTDIVDFRKPNFELHPGTALGGAFDLLAQRIAQEVVRTTREAKGDFRPLVFLFTDGYPTDQWRESFARFKSIRPKPALVYAFGCGDDVDYAQLQNVADAAFRITPTSESELPDLFKRLFVWLSASVQSASLGVGAENPLDSANGPTPKGVERVVDAYPQSAPGSSTPTRVFFPAICARTRKRAVLRFTFDKTVGRYTQSRSFPVPDSFYEGGSLEAPSVSTELIATPPAQCPYCENHGWVYCDCGALYCAPVPLPRESVCPSCGERGYLGDGGDFSITSSLG